MGKPRLQSGKCFVHCHGAWLTRPPPWPHLCDFALGHACGHKVHVGSSAQVKEQLVALANLDQKAAGHLQPAATAAEN